MPISYVVMDDGVLVYAKAQGVLTVGDLVAHEAALIADRRVAPGFRQLLDCRWIEGETLEPEVAFTRLRCLDRWPPEKLVGSRHAVVAYSPRWFGTGGHYRGEKHGATMIVFSDPATACVWLGVDYEGVMERVRAEVYLPLPSGWNLAKIVPRMEGSPRPDRQSS